MLTFSKIFSLFRYKMVSQYTWPNYRNGTDKEGVQSLIQEKGFGNDTQYGHTKIFIRSPRTLFALEKVFTNNSKNYETNDFLVYSKYDSCYSNFFECRYIRRIIESISINQYYS